MPSALELLHHPDRSQCEVENQDSNMCCSFLNTENWSKDRKTHFNYSMAKPKQFQILLAITFQHSACECLSCGHLQEDSRCVHSGLSVML